jgi:uncharacterized protein (TIGR03545 family)
MAKSNSKDPGQQNPSNKKLGTTESKPDVAKAGKSVKPKKKDLPTKFFPKKFKESYKRKKFETKILKRIFIPAEKDFLLGFYEKKEEFYELKNAYADKKKALTKSDHDRLVRLAKSIKKNASAVNWFLLTFFGVILGGALVVSFLLLPVWLDAEVEKALESAFGSEVDLDGLELNLLEGKLGFASLAVEDRRNPTRNLFQMDQAEIHINTGELLSSRFHIDSIQAQGIRWGTPRAPANSSGAGGSEDGSSGDDAGQMSDISDEAASEDPFTGFFADILGSESGGEIIPKEIVDLNVEDLFQAQIDQLESPAAVEASTSFYESSLEAWTSKTELTGSDIQSFTSSAQDLAATNLASINDVASAQKLIADIDSVYSQYNSLKGSIDSLIRQAQSDWDEIQSLQETIANALASDEAFLNELISLPLTGEDSLASRLILDPLVGSLGEYGVLALTALQFVENLSSGDPSSEPAPIREGIDIPVPIPGKPDFLIRDAGFSLGLKGNDGYHALVFKNVSSNSAVMDGPLLISYEGQVGEPIISFSILEQKEESSYTLQAGFQGQRFSQRSGLEILGVSSIEGSVSFTADLVLGDNSTRFHMQLRLDDLQTQYGEASEISSLVREIFRRTNFFTLDLIIADLAGEKSIEISSNAESIFRDTIQGWLDQKIDEAKTLLLAEFQSSIESALGENQALYEEISALFDSLEDDQLSLDSAKSLMDQKKVDIEKRIQELAVESIIPDNITVPNINLPGF